MAVYCWVDDLVTCGLTAGTPGSAPGPTLGNEYGKTLPLHTPCLPVNVVKLLTLKISLFFPTLYFAVT